MDLKDQFTPRLLSHDNEFLAYQALNKVSSGRMGCGPTKKGHGMNGELCDQWNRPGIRHRAAAIPLKDSIDIRSQMSVVRE